jgi:hypothetical protein
LLLSLGEYHRMNLGMPDRHPGPASGCGWCFI